MEKNTVSVRMPLEIIDLLKQVSKDRGEDVSDFVRRSVRMELGRLSFLSDTEKKALGLEVK